MTATKQNDTTETSLARDFAFAAHYYLGGRRGLLLIIALAIAGGLFFNWSWLVALGIAPIVLGVLPCIAMCALGLCAHSVIGRVCGGRKSTAETIQQDQVRRGTGGLGWSTEKSDADNSSQQ